MLKFTRISNSLIGSISVSGSVCIFPFKITIENYEMKTERDSNADDTVNYSFSGNYVLLAIAKFQNYQCHLTCAND